jgi:hypothetical protein
MIAVSGALIVRHIVEERSPMRGDLQKSSMTTSFLVMLCGGRTVATMTE